MVGVTTTARSLTSKPKTYSQLGAPTLLYLEKNNHQSAFSELDGHEFPVLEPWEMADILRRENRIKARWNYSIDLERIKQVKVLKRKSRKRVRKSVEMDQGSGHSEFEILQMKRFGMLMEHDMWNETSSRELLRSYEIYDSRNTQESSNPLGKTADLYAFEKYATERRFTSDPAYLAPFGVDALEESMRDETGGRKDTVDKSKTPMREMRPPQGNCLVVASCPCPSCVILKKKTADHSWCLFHPTGPFLDTLSVSNLIQPNGIANAGHFFSVATWENNARRGDQINSIQKQFPNQVCLDKPIVEVKQGGSWDSWNKECLFVVRTTAHISVVQASVEYPKTVTDACDFAAGTCWGNYPLKEVQRIELRSCNESIPSYRPISLACHPRYGNQYSSPIFAFSSYCESNGSQNTVHRCSFPDDEVPSIHTFPALRSIDLVEFTSTHPMLLWSAAASFSRPALRASPQFKTQPPLGFGTSVYTLDLRTHDPIFQWSPSAEEMTTEGVHAISGLLNDWQSFHTLWVTSKSAGSMWEIDSRMPCRVVNKWSLTSGCEDASATFPRRSVFGDPSLLAKAVLKDGSQSGLSAPILNVDSTPGAFGLHLYQRPARRPPFENQCIETISTPQKLRRLGVANASFSKVYALAEVSATTYTCGIAPLWTKLRSFATDEEARQGSLPDGEADMLCILTLTNNGDIYCHSLLESSVEIPGLIASPATPTCSGFIRLLPSMDGKTSDLEHKSWKPSGGRNLKMFLSNHVPTPRSGHRIVKPLSSRLERHVWTKLRRGDHPSIKSRKAQSGHKVKREESRSGGMVSCGESSRKLGDNSLSVTIPKSLAHLPRRRSSGALAGERRSASKPESRSDLSSHLLQNVAVKWDGWNESDSDSGDEKVIKWDL